MPMPNLMWRSWETHADEWIRWARTPGHDSYWRFHRGAFLPLVPAPGRLTVDLGCGEGRVSRDLQDMGHRVLAVDRSITLARAAHLHPQSPFTVVTAEAASLPVATAAADCVVAFMSLQDIEPLDGAIGEIARILEPGGRLVLAIVHPVNSAGSFVGERADPRRPFVIEGSYLDSHRYTDLVERDGLNMTFDSAHRPLQTYTDALADAGFLIERLREPTDPDPAKPWSRVPLFLHIKATLHKSPYRS